MHLIACQEAVRFNEDSEDTKHSIQILGLSPVYFEAAVSMHSEVPAFRNSSTIFHTTHKGSRISCSIAHKRLDICLPIAVQNGYKSPLSQDLV